MYFKQNFCYTLALNICKYQLRFVYNGQVLKLLILNYNQTNM